jgi:predicted lipoprotein with Yx(FWY)xxD motif
MPTDPHGANGPSSARPRPHRRSGFAALLSVVAAVTMVSVASASSGPNPPLNKANAGGYSGILVSSTHRSLYVLSVESGGHIRCRAACLSFWPPMIVKSSVTTVKIGNGVKGKIGFVRRSATTKQVTFNGFPVYWFSGDSGPNQVNGQGISLDGGMWSLVHAGSSSARSTRVKTIHTQTTTTTTPATTTTSPTSTTTPGSTVPSTTTTMPSTTTTAPLTTTTCPTSCY